MTNVNVTVSPGQIWRYILVNTPWIDFSFFIIGSAKEVEESVWRINGMRLTVSYYENNILDEVKVDKLVNMNWDFNDINMEKIDNFGSVKKTTIIDIFKAHKTTGSINIGFEL